MKFVVYRCTMDKDFFIVTDPEHDDQITGSLCPNGGEVEKVGEYPEMGRERVAFDEDIAKNSIREHGFYRFEAKTWAPEERPLERCPNLPEVNAVLCLVGGSRRIYGDTAIQAPWILALSRSRRMCRGTTHPR